jgi:hypothetical protein
MKAIRVRLLPSAETGTTAIGVRVTIFLLVSPDQFWILHSTLFLHHTKAFAMCGRALMEPDETLCTPRGGALFRRPEGPSTVTRQVGGRLAFNPAAAGVRLYRNGGRSATATATQSGVVNHMDMLSHRPPRVVARAQAMGVS